MDKHEFSKLAARITPGSFFNINSFRTKFGISALYPHKHACLVDFMENYKKHQLIDEKNVVKVATSLSKDVYPTLV